MAPHGDQIDNHDLQDKRPVDTVWEQRKLEARKMLVIAQNPQRPVRALLGALMERKISPCT